MHRMVVLEVYKGKFYKQFKDGSVLGDERIQDADNIGVYELEHRLIEYAAPPGKKKPLIFGGGQEEPEPSEHPMDGNKLVTVFSRSFQQISNVPGRLSLHHIDWPFLISLTQEEAQDYDIIHQKILGIIATHTTRDFLRETGGSEANSDVVVMNTEDTDSSSESKVRTKSVESEDELVDISMRDPEDELQAASNTPPAAALPKAKPLAPMLRPGAYITPEVRSLFDIKYFAAEGGRIPTGLNTLQQEDAELLSLRDRYHPERRLTPRQRLDGLVATRDEDARIEQLEDKARRKQEKADAGLPPEPGLVQDSGSESDGLPPVEQLTQPKKDGNGRLSKRPFYRNQRLRVYGHNDGPYIGDKDTSTHEAPDNQPWVNAGEVLVLDYTLLGWDALFGGTPGAKEDRRGTLIWDDIAALPDPEREQRRIVRQHRKKHGVTLDDCLDEFRKPETLSENDAWYCDRCKLHRRARKTFELWKAPDVLVIHLKRFSAQGRLRDKLDILVEFPVQGLDLSSRVSIDEEGKSLVYDLFAVDNHYGGLGGGHYTAFAKNYIDGNWYEYNGKQRA